MEKKKILWIILLLFFMFLSCAGQYIEIVEELNEDGSVARRLGDLFVGNHGLNIENEEEFRSIVTENLPPQPNAYQEIRQVNMGKITPNNDEQTEMEIGPNRCAVR